MSKVLLLSLCGLLLVDVSRSSLFNKKPPKNLCVPQQPKFASFKTIKLCASYSGKDQGCELATNYKETKDLFVCKVIKQTSREKGTCVYKHSDGVLEGYSRRAGKYSSGGLCSLSKMKSTCGQQWTVFPGGRTANSNLDKNAARAKCTWQQIGAGGAGAAGDGGQEHEEEEEEEEEENVSPLMMAAGVALVLVSLCGIAFMMCVCGVVAGYGLTTVAMRSMAPKAGKQQQPYVAVARDDQEHV